MKTELTQLGKREKQVLALAALGLKTNIIAKQLSISEDTVRFHLKKINQKLNSRNRTHAVAIAIKSGIITI